MIVESILPHIRKVFLPHIVGVDITFIVSEPYRGHTIECIHNSTIAVDRLHTFLINESVIFDIKEPSSNFIKTRIVYLEKVP